MPATVSIGRFQFDLDALVLYDEDRVVALPPLPAQILAMLVSARGGVVSASAIRDALWGDAAVEERNLNQQIYVLRRVLRDDARVSIENVPRRGYRLVVALDAAAEPAPSRGNMKRRSRWLAVAAIAAAIGLFVWVRAVTTTPGAANRDLALANYLSTSEGPDHLELAAAYYRSIIARGPNAAAYGGLAMVDVKRALALTGDRRSRAFETARSEATAALGGGGSDSNALTALGLIAAVYDRKCATAARFFNAAVAADPQDETPRTWRAKFLMSVGDFDVAGQDFRTMGEMAPTSGYAVGSFGEWLVLRHQYGKASDVLARAVALGNHPGYTRYWLAKADLLRGRNADALRLSNVLLGMYPNEASALVLRLQAEIAQGDRQAAEADFRTLIEIPKLALTDPVALASAEVALGHRDEALRVVRGYVASGAHDLDELGRLRSDPDLDAIRIARAPDAPISL
ncbi:MAG: winged helix-turn-helix domain-containing protein [Candidatus Eremiobacteraeota bacterium]|nr:winged helix-turn-helix domain-containing protein [Candidatus Eremiobacteraeota bacterium]